jgi:hypothetical protein
MAEESPFGLTNENQDFSNLQEQNVGTDRQIPSTDPNKATLSDDDANAVNRTNTQNGNKTNTASQSSTANAVATNQTTGVIGDSQYFNYRGVNGKNAADPNFESDQHILTIDSIIDYFNKYPSFGLKFTHFAYLKKLGVYPNNRMIIARRYSSPVPDNMFDTGGMTPIATVVSWMDPKESLLEISFNEKWEDATESLIDIFKEILSNDIGINLDPPIPLPGFTVGLQYGIMNALGLTNADADNVPQGNPNLIHETMRRRVPGDDLGGSGLESDFKIKMVCEYEQKYIGKVDPIVGYLDVIGNLLMMGTSEEEYLLTGSASEELQNLFDLAKEGKWRELATTIIEKIVEGIDTLIEELGDVLSDEPTGGGDGEGGGGSADYETTYQDNGGPSQSEVVQGFKSGIDGFKNAIGALGDAILSGIFSKYREKLQAAIASMSGLPNGPWHVMMGNPKNPFFVSGDMICTKVTIDFKSELAYNDLPAEFTATLEFKPARSHGRSGIGSKLNHGKGRIYGAPPKDTTAANGSIGSSTRNTNANVSGATQLAPDPGTGGDRTPI